MVADATRPHPFAQPLVFRHPSIVVLLSESVHLKDRGVCSKKNLTRSPARCFPPGTFGLLLVVSNISRPRNFPHLKVCAIWLHHQCRPPGEAMETSPHDLRCGRAAHVQRLVRGKVLRRRWASDEFVLGGGRLSGLGVMDASKLIAKRLRGHARLLSVCTSTGLCVGEYDRTVRWDTSWSHDTRHVLLVHRVWYNVQHAICPCRHGSTFCGSDLQRRCFLLAVVGREAKGFRSEARFYKYSGEACQVRGVHTSTTV